MKTKKLWKLEWHYIDERVPEVHRSGWHKFGRYKTRKRRDQAYDEVVKKPEFVKREYRKIDPERTIQNDKKN